ncbi:MAG: hypothetical protein E7318_05055 [Clostridiales bacterium]|nr:hypothetical protein [Clostridiales bacterium]
MTKLSLWLKKDGWILAALCFCVAMCLLLGAQQDTASTEENRVSRVLSAIQGAGDVEVAFYYENAVPCGAVIVAQGANDIAVQLRLASAVTKLLGIDANRVAIYPKEAQK